VDEQMQLLVELQKLDTNILALSHKIDATPSLIAAEEAPYKEALKACEAIRQQQLSLEKKKKDRERQVEDLSEKITKLKTRSSEIKTNREYQAHLKEIEGFEAEIHSIEDDVLTIMEALETVSKKAEAENARLSAVKAETDELNNKRESEIKIIEQELQAAKEQRSSLAHNVDPELYTLYMNLLKGGRGLAAAEVKKEICQGCNMNIPPQLFVEIKKSAGVFQCPQCRRILYYVKPADETLETAEGN
jgi:uncharacterized protein